MTKGKKGLSDYGLTRILNNSKKNKNKSLNNLLYKIILSILVGYTFLFIFFGAFGSINLVFFLFPLFLLFLLTVYTYLSPKNFSLPEYTVTRNKIFYCFLFIVFVSLYFLPIPSSLNSQINSFVFFPKKILSNYNIYINYALIIGFLILIIPDVKGTSVNWHYWQKNPFYKSIISKVLFFVILPIPVFIGFSCVIYKYELKENINILLQAIFIGCICTMLAYLFIILKKIVLEIINYFFK